MELECEKIDKSKTIVVLKPAKIIYKDSKMPYLILVPRDFDDLDIANITESLKPRLHVFCVAPFRGYRFQVSNNLMMQGDLGASAVIGFGNLFHATTRFPESFESTSSLYASNCGVFGDDGSMIKPVLNAFLMEAIKSFENTAYGEAYKIEFDYNSYQICSEYINAVYEYVKHNL